MNATSLTLLQALRLSSTSAIALVGAGGKTTALYQIGREYRQGKPLVLLTTSTHLGYDQVLAAEFHLVVHRGSVEETLRRLPSDQGLICLTADWDNQTQRWRGLDPEMLQMVARYAHERSIPLLVEADGARGRSLKAPAEHEPALPSFCDPILVVAGLAALGRPLSEEWVHRPQRFAELSGLRLDETISIEAVQRVLSHPLGGRKNIPTTAKSHVLLTQAEMPEAQAAAKKLSLSLLERFDSVIVASKGQPFRPSTAVDFRHPYRILAAYEPVAGVVLAAGASSRFGQPKPLLAWQGETLVHRAARLALEAGLRPVLVVCGAEGDRVAAAVADLPVQVVWNTAWESGQSTSIRAAVQALGEKTGATLFLLVDQPFVSTRLLQSLVETHAQTLAPVIAPQVGGQRGNPVLFDRSTFPDLLRLEGDVGGRGIFARYPLQWLPWQDERLLFDLDTPEDYQRLLQMDAEDA
ncbi:MAG: selenium cofactor biosynthesis protein YqeC [Anaerolineales bacterium]|nr:selenium cofactor biosynthesis protein YqeC [Anaerolineales bacterium]MDW8446926.1 selenium cofactor biosynthesis protein YqeC [Anaerolineales bacterium]